MLYYMPSKIYHEENAAVNHAAEMAAFGKKALIVTGGQSSKKNGSLDDVREALKSQGVPSVVFDGVEENPSTDTILKARDFGVSEGADFVIGIGGGSPMDASKAVAVMMCYPGEGEDFLYTPDPAIRHLPVVCVATTCGTGSEATGVAVLTLRSKGIKTSMPHKIFPDLSLVDPRYIMNAPLSVIANTSIDALSHAVESYINLKATPYSRMFAAEGMRIWRECKEILTGEKKGDPADFSRLMLASTVSGMAIAHTGTSLPHGLSYHVTYELGVPHGKAVGYFLAGHLREAPAQDREEVLKLTGFADPDEFQAYYEKACGAEKLPENVLKDSVAEVLRSPKKLASAPFETDEAVLKRMAGLI